LGSANHTLRLRLATRLLPLSNTAVRYIYAVEKNLRYFVVRLNNST